MSSKNNTGAQGNNQTAGGNANSPAAPAPIKQDGELNIPTLSGALKPPAPVVQEGENAPQAVKGVTDDPIKNDGGAQAMTSSLGINVDPKPSYEQLMAENEALRRSSMQGVSIAAQPTGAPAPNAPSLTDMVKAEVSQAIHRPVMAHYDDDHNDVQMRRDVVDVPITGRLDDFMAKRRSDLYIEPVAPALFNDIAAELAFLEEYVIIEIHETMDPQAELVIHLAINGRSVYLARGRHEIVKRKYVEQLLRAKPQTVKTQVAKGNDGDYVNRTIKSAAMKYPFAIVRDDNPKGRAWMKKILQEG